ncbi:hypothetical protein BC833DRAFT_630926 [Globomyces pollinis-pini]|nr:hypothetical protein BC833DRAFT_630926 [Globomyces pollinis-pini]
MPNVLVEETNREIIRSYALSSRTEYLSCLLMANSILQHCVPNLVKQPLLYLLEVIIGSNNTHEYVWKGEFERFKIDEAHLHTNSNHKSVSKLVEKVLQRRHELKQRLVFALLTTNDGVIPFSDIMLLMFSIKKTRCVIHRVVMTYFEWLNFDGFFWSLVAVAAINEEEKGLSENERLAYEQLLLLMFLETPIGSVFGSYPAAEQRFQYMSPFLSLSLGIEITFTFSRLRASLQRTSNSAEFFT